LSLFRAAAFVMLYPQPEALTMYWVIRGTESRTNEDFELVVEAMCGAAAEMWALKRNIPFVFIGEAEEADVERARAAKRLWSFTPPAKYRCLGQPVMAKQLACLLLCGVWTIVLILTRTTPLPRVLARTMMSSTRDIRPAHGAATPVRTLGTTSVDVA
jgi:hypothetical protein